MISNLKRFSFKLGFLKAAVILLVLGIPFSAYVFGTFTKHYLNTTFYGASGSFIVDLDEDGDTDIVGIAYTAGEFSWWSNNGSQSFTKNQENTTLGAPIALHVIDVDGETGMDVLVADYGANDVIWFENNGSETFTKRTVDSNLPSAFDVHGVDMEPDGDIDILAVGRTNPGNLVWYENDGLESFTKRTISGAIASPYAVFGIDLDEDGDTDVVTDSVYNAFGKDDRTFWFENDGSENFTRHTIDATSQSFGQDVFVIDLDSDGDYDVLAAFAVADDIVWFENDGSESFTKKYVDSNFNNASGVYAMDLDDDGDVDVVGCSNSDGDIAVWENDGSQNFTKTVIEGNFGFCYHVHAGDVDGDGDGDVSSQTYNDGDIAWFEQGGTAAPEVSSYSPADGATGVLQTANLVITFDEAVQGGTGTITIKKTSDNSTVETINGNGAEVSGSGTTTITINPASTLAESTGYYVLISGNAFVDMQQTDYAGIADTTTWNFTVGDFTAPSASSFSPLDDATDVSVSSDLSITFDQVIGTGGTGSVSIYKSVDDSLVETISVTSAQVTGSGTTTMTINPSADLSASTEFYVQISANAFPDSSGNSYVGISDTTTWSFTTAASTSGGGHGSATVRLRRSRESSGTTYEYREAPSLAEVGITSFEPTRVARVSDIEGDEVGTEEEDRIQRLFRRMEEHAAAPEPEPELPSPMAVAVKESVDEKFMVRVCKRVENRFSGDPRMLERVNRRLRNRFDFVCEE